MAEEGRRCLAAPSSIPVSLNYLRADLTTDAALRPIRGGKKGHSYDVCRKGMRLPRRFAPRNDVCSNLDS